MVFWDKAKTEGSQSHEEPLLQIWFELVQWLKIGNMWKERTEGFDRPILCFAFEMCKYAKTHKIKLK